MCRSGIIAFVAFTLSVSASGFCVAATYESFDDLTPFAVLVSDRTQTTFSSVRAAVEKAGARGLQMFPPDALFGYLPERPAPSLFADLPVALCLAREEVAGHGLDPIVARVVDAHFNRKELLRAAMAEAPFVPGPIEDVVLRASEADVRAATPAGPRLGSPRELSDRGPTQNSEFLIGSVVLNLVFPESAGGSENWTDQELSDVLVATSLGLSQYMQKALWVDLSFTYNYRNSTRVPVSIEPITSSMDNDYQWVGEAISYLGFEGGAYYGTHFLNNQARDSLKTDWSYTCYIVDMSAHYSADPPSPDPGCWGGAGYVAYSYLGGPYMVIPYPACRYGYGLGFGRVFIHEMSHGFWALDEYASAEQTCMDRSGYLDIPNMNTLYNPCQATTPCIMQTASPPFTDPQPICEYTQAQVGLGDANDNSVPDIYDVSPEIEFMTIPGIEMDTLLPDDEYWLSVKVWNDAVPNLNPQQYEGMRIDYAAGIKSGEISFNGSPFMPIDPSDGAWDESSEIMAFLLTEPLDAGINTITLHVKNIVDLEAQADKQVFVIGLKYYYLSAAARDTTINVIWTTASEVFGAVFDVLRTDLTAGGGETLVETVTEPDETSVNRRAYSYLDRDVKPGHEYVYRIRGVFDVNVRGEDRHYTFTSQEVGQTAIIPVGKLVSHLLPNPMTNSTAFTISIPKTFRDVSGSRETAGARGAGLAPASTEVRTDVDVAVYNVLGQRIKTIYSNSRYGGVITRTWDGADWNGKLVPSGVYFLYVRAGDLKETKKIIVIR